MPRNVNARKKKPQLSSCDKTLLNQLLLLAISENRADDIPGIISQGAVVTFEHEKKLTALHSAIAFEHAECIPPLLAAGAEINAKIDIGSTPLHIAAESSNANIAKILLRAKADVLATDAVGNTALHIAACIGNVDCVRELIIAGSPMRALNDNGFSPFELAAIRNQGAVIRAFADLGCSQAIEAVKNAEEATKKSENDQGNAITRLFRKASSTLGRLFPQRIKDTGYLLGQLGLSLAIPYSLDVPTPVIATTALLVSVYIIKQSISDLRSLNAGKIPNAKDLETAPMAHPAHVKSVLSYAQICATQLKLDNVNVFFDHSDINPLAQAFYDTNSIFINKELVTKWRDPHELKGLIDHEMQHLNINKNWFEKIIKQSNRILRAFNSLTMTADFWSKIIAGLSPVRIPYLSDLVALRSSNVYSMLLFRHIGNFLLFQQMRDEEYNADDNAFELTKNGSLEENLKNILLCQKAKVVVLANNKKLKSVSKNSTAWIEEGWESKKPLASFCGLFSQTHPPLADRIQNLQVKREQHISKLKI